MTLCTGSMVRLGGLVAVNQQPEAQVSGLQGVLGMGWRHCVPSRGAVGPRLCAVLALTLEHWDSRA